MCRALVGRHCDCARVHVCQVSLPETSYLTAIVKTIRKWQRAAKAAIARKPIPIVTLKYVRDADAVAWLSSACLFVPVCACLCVSVCHQGLGE